MFAKVHTPVLLNTYSNGQAQVVPREKCSCRFVVVENLQTCMFAFGKLVHTFSGKYLSCGCEYPLNQSA